MERRRQDSRRSPSAESRPDHDRVGARTKRRPKVRNAVSGSGRKTGPASAGTFRRNRTGESLSRIPAEVRAVGRVGEGRGPPAHDSLRVLHVGRNPH